MNLLPKSHHEFGTGAYWEKFFKKRGTQAFEWYGEYPELCGILHKYIKPADKILMVGCGNSNLSADMYDVGYRHIVNVDLSETAIRQMQDKHKEQRPDMKFLVMDMMHMTFEDKEFSVVLDKGTLDAILTGDDPEVLAKVDQMFAEISRVLRVGGRYICITLAQEYILRKVLQYFPSEGWPVRICRVHKDVDEEEAGSYMPVFVCVFTRFNKMPNMKPILEVSCFEDKVERCDGTDDLYARVHELQYYGLLRQQLKKRGRVEEQLSIQLHSADLAVPRYTIHIVDATELKANKFAVFIVPQGRENEWLFSTGEGRTELCTSAGFQRLAVVTLHREHSYENMDAIKADLSYKIMELGPADIGKSQVPFLSLGDDINARTVQFSGHSELSGEFVIEDVAVDGEILRRLIFLSNMNIIQSEGRLVKATRSGKGKKKRAGKLSIDPNYLSMGYYPHLVAGLALLDDFHRTIEGGVNLLLIGLGGGGLPLYIHNNFTKVHQEVVEIDPVMLSIATDWFGFVQSDRMVVTIGDGLQVVKDKAASGTKHQVIILDVDSKDTSVGMSGPPQPFIARDFLVCLDQVLDSKGVLLINLVCRNTTLRHDVLTTLKSVFKEVFVTKVSDDINECVYCLPSHRQHSLVESGKDKLPKTVFSAARILQQAIEMEGRVRSVEVPELAQMLEELTLT